MSTHFNVTFCLRSAPNRDEIDAFLRYCFDELGCSRAAPDGSQSDLFSFSTKETGYLAGENVEVEEAITTLANAERGAIWFWYDALNSGVHINGCAQTQPDVPTISLTLDETYAKPYWNTDSSLVYEFILELYDYLAPIYVYGDAALDGSSLSREGIMTGHVEDLFWVNGFGPKMVDKISRDQLLNAPAWRIDECDDGGIFLWVSPLPYSKSRNELTEDHRTYLELK